MSHLAQSIRHWLQSNKSHTAVSLEGAAKAANGTISRLLKGGEISKEKLSSLLDHLPQEYADDWALSYLRDQCPLSYRDRLDIVITGAEEPASTGPISEIEQFKRYLRALNSLGQENNQIVEWLNLSCALILPEITSPKITKINYLDSTQNFISRVAEGD